MKNISKAIAIPFLVILANLALAQEIKTSLYSDIPPSSLSARKGTSLGIMLPGFIGDIELGGFYEYYNTTSFALAGVENQEVKSVNTFAGVYSSFSLVGSEKMALSLVLKMGVEKDNRLVGMPSLKAEYYFSDKFGLGLSTRMTNGLPAFQLSIDFIPSGIKERTKRRVRYMEKREFNRSKRSEKPE